MSHPPPQSPLSPCQHMCIHVKSDWLSVLLHLLPVYQCAGNKRKLIPNQLGRYDTINRLYYYSKNNFFLINVVSLYTVYDYIYTQPARSFALRSAQSVICGGEKKKFINSRALHARLKLKQ